MTHILALTGGGGTEGRGKKRPAPCLSQPYTEKETDLDASARIPRFQAEGLQSIHPPDFQLSFG